MTNGCFLTSKIALLAHVQIGKNEYSLINNFTSPIAGKIIDGFYTKLETSIDIQYAVLSHQFSAGAPSGNNQLVTEH